MGRSDFALALAAAGVVALGASTARAELTAQTSQSRISVDSFYHGSTVSVRGVADADVDLVIRVASPDGREVFQEKGRKAGILWMNIGKREFVNAPKLYKVISTRPVEEILEPGEALRHVLGYPALARHVEMTPSAPPPDEEREKEKWFSEFVKYKEGARLYQSSTGQIASTPAGDKREYVVQARWPHEAPPGEYLVTAYAVRGGKVVETAQSNLVVEQVGSVRRLAQMAQNSAAFYGLISILAAVGGGFGIGLVFGRGGSPRRNARSASS